MVGEIVGFEHLHLHSTEGSLLDGYGLIDEYTANAKKINQQYFCLSDHGMMSGVPRQIACCDKYGLHPIFAVEIYYQPKQPCVQNGETMQQHLKDMSPDERKNMQKSYHMTLWAKNDEGYKNLVRLTSFGWIHGFYYKPRINWDQLVQHKEGLMVGSGCYNSPVAQAFDKSGTQLAMEAIKKYHALFGENYYLEIMLLDFCKQKPYNHFLIQAHAQLGIPLVLTQDCHYCKKEDSKFQRLMLMVGSRRTVSEVEQAVEENKAGEFFELQDQNLWQKSEEELNEKWLESYSDVIPLDLFNQAKRNTVRICEACKGVQLDRTIKLPQFPDEDDRLEAMVKEGAHKRDMPNTNEYTDRAKEEFALVKDKGFSAYFIIEKMMVDAARKKCPEILGWGTGNEAVGPGRGSGAGFLLNYLLGITDVDPVKHDLLSSRFLSPARGGKQMCIRFEGKPL
jgi:DNA polymerase-3 subunit alpha